MKSTRFAAAVLALAAVASCRQRDLRTVQLHVPEMKNDACVEVVSRAVGGVQGIEKDTVTVDPATRTVQVTYDSLKLSLKNLEFAVADAGFAANDAPANPKAAAALPPECRGGP